MRQNDGRDSGTVGSKRTVAVRRRGVRGRWSEKGMKHGVEAGIARIRKVVGERERELRERRDNSVKEGRSQRIL